VASPALPIALPSTLVHSSHPDNASRLQFNIDGQPAGGVAPTRILRRVGGERFEVKFEGEINIRGREMSISSNRIIEKNDLVMTDKGRRLYDDYLHQERNDRQHIQDGDIVNLDLYVLDQNPLVTPIRRNTS